MYNLHSLGWNSFQQLCITITSEILGQTVQSFLGTNDGGRDGAFSGLWNPTGKENLRGHFVIQCKFTSRANYGIHLSDLTDEIDKVERLVKNGLCDSYVLMTNAGVSGSRAEIIEATFKNAGAKHVLILGSTWIIQQIRESKRLRMLVPRVYGLGDLSQILDERAYLQTYAILDTLRDDLSKVVVTDAYRRSAAALDKHGFVLLIGEPASGKTTIASMLAMTAIDQWNAPILKLDEPNKVIKHWNPEEPEQFFWLDDAFGVSQYEFLLVRGWNHILPQIRTMLRKGVKIVMTSRDYIYNQARKELKEGAFPLLEESQVVIDVHELTDSEKRQILYNHLKLGKQPRPFLSKIKPYLDSVATNQHFIPEIARRLADPVFTAGMYISFNNLNEFVEKRERFLQEILQGLDIHSRAALALIYMRSNWLESPIDLQESEKNALERLESNIGKCISALDALNDSLVIHSHISGDFGWRFKHPTIGDAYAAILAQNPELLGVFIKGITTEKFITQVTCGDVGIKKATIIPKGLFPDVIEKLASYTDTKNYKSKGLSRWQAESAIQRFLARRCSREFLSLYIEQNPELMDDVGKPGLYLNAVSEVDLAVRINEYGILPENIRKKFIEIVSEYAINGEDLYALDDEEIKTVFSDDEFDELLVGVRTKLLPRLDEVRQEYQDNYYQDEEPDVYMLQLFGIFEILEKYYGDESNVIRNISEQTEIVNEWIEENKTDAIEREPRVLGSIDIVKQANGPRSIFDDIDV